MHATNMRTPPALLALLLASAVPAQGFEIVRDGDAVRVLRAGNDQPVVTQVAAPDHRPYLHPITAPDGHGVLTEFSPGHHRHQTGLYWGFTRLDGRDYFHNPGATHWRRREVAIEQESGPRVAWRTIYELLGEDGAPLLVETQQWTLAEHEGRLELDLVWHGLPLRDLTLGRYDYGGLFLRMPWKPGIDGHAVNAQRQVDGEAEGQRTPWVDVGMAIDGRDDQGRIAILDHHQNPGYPQAFRVDGQLGIGPSPQRLGNQQWKKDQPVTYRHRIVVSTGPHDGMALQETWSRYTGQPYAWALWGMAQQEGRDAEFLTAEQAVAKMTVPDGFAVNAFASEPMIAQPMAFCWDDRGRLWVAENRDYEARNKGFANSGDSRILILEDTDRDGVADRRETFLEGIPFPSAVAVGLDGLWLAAPPHLLFVPDRDGDDRADMDDIEVRLTGWGIRDRHETLNSLTWGPDGWLYGCQGFATPSLVGRPKGEVRLPTKGDAFPENLPLDGPGTPINGGVWRYHPTKRRFEVVAHGFSNPWGLDFDARGNLFITACVLPHLWHIVPGGIYQRQGGSHFNPHVYDDLKTIVDHPHRSAHGGARVYLSDAFPAEYHGQLFMANIHEHAVLGDVLTPRGSSFVASHGTDFLKAHNAQWVGFSMELGPDGNLFVLDWHDADICGSSVQNGETGRIYRIAPVKSEAVQWDGRHADLQTLPDAALVDLQRSPSSWHARRARVVLQGRAVQGALASGTRDTLRSRLAGDAPAEHRLRALWALHVTEGLDAARLAALLDDPLDDMRAWSIRLLCEDDAPADEVVARFADLARTDPSPTVRLALASALQRLPHQARWPIARALAEHGEDAQDHNLPLMVWFGIEPAVPNDPARAVQFARASRLPHLTRFTARRLAAADRLGAVLGAAADGPASWSREVLLGVQDGLRGRNDVAPPAGWAALRGPLASRPMLAPLVAALAQTFGDRDADAELLATLDDPARPAAERGTALRALAAVAHAGVPSRLPACLDDETLRVEAIRAVAAYEAPELADLLLARYESFTETERSEVVQALAARPGSARRLTEALREGKVSKRDVPAWLARQLRRVVGNTFVDVWGPIDAAGADLEAQYARYRALLTDEALADADPRRGRAVFQRTCATCHTMYDAGGTLGPELTGSNRGNLEYLLGNILAPSEEIQDAYRMVMVVTRDGRTYGGTIAAETDESLTLRVVGQDDVTVLAKADVTSRTTLPVSLMPPGLLTTLEDPEVLDLVRYLQSDAQVPLPTTTGK